MLQNLQLLQLPSTSCTDVFILVHEVSDFVLEACVCHGQLVGFIVVLEYGCVVEYQVSSEEAEAKVTEMTKAVEELQKLLKQATHGEI